MSAATSVERDVLASALRSGLGWLYDTLQPDGAVLTHHGITRPVPELNRRLSFVPSGWAGHVVIVLDVAQPEWNQSTDPWELRNGLAEGEHDRLADLLGDLGRSVVHRWNGQPGMLTGSLALADPTHPSLLKAVRRYLDGCPEHRSVFCGHDGCNWYRDGRRLVVEPGMGDAR